MRFLRDALITLAVLIGVFGIVAYGWVRAGGASADGEPSRVEQSVATRLVRLSVPAGVERQKNPFSQDATAWRSAADHFEDHCAVCHGSDGRGRTDMGDNMYPRVPDLADPAVQRFSDGALFSIIQNGVRWTGMPAWKREHSPEDTWKLVAFVRRVPSLTSADLEAIRHEPDRHQHEPNHPGHHDSHRPPR
jgi:mono/diheme cytochrome c family protein